MKKHEAYKAPKQPPSDGDPQIKRAREFARVISDPVVLDAVRGFAGQFVDAGAKPAAAQIGLGQRPFGALTIELGDKNGDGRVDVSVTATIAGRSLPPLVRNLDLSTGLSLLMSMRDRLQSLLSEGRKPSFGGEF